MKKKLITALLYLLASNCIAQTITNSYPSLLQLSKELRLLERTSLPNGVPDYRSATISKTQQTLQQYKNHLQKIDTAGWLLEQKVDYVLTLAEIGRAHV